MAEKTALLTLLYSYQCEIFTARTTEKDLSMSLQKINKQHLYKTTSNESLHLSTRIQKRLIWPRLMKVFWTKEVVCISSVPTDLIENNFPENHTLLTLLHRDDYYNTFTKPSISVKAAISFNFGWSWSPVLPSVKDCRVL